MWSSCPTSALPRWRGGPRWATRSSSTSRPSRTATGPRTGCCPRCCERRRGFSAPRVHREAGGAAGLGVHLLELLALLALGALRLQLGLLAGQGGGLLGLLGIGALDAEPLLLLGAGLAHGLQLLCLQGGAVDELGRDDGGLGLEAGEHRLLRFRGRAEAVVEARVDLLLHLLSGMLTRRNAAEGTPPHLPFRAGI